MPGETHAAWLLRTYDRAKKLGLQTEARSIKQFICRRYGIEPMPNLRLVVADEEIGLAPVSPDTQAVAV